MSRTMLLAPHRNAGQRAGEIGRARIAFASLRPRWWMAGADRPTVLGIPIDVQGLAAVDGLREFAVGLVHVATVNPEYVMLARRDRVFAGALRSADVFLADGVGVIAALRLRGVGAVRATGVELVERLVASGEKVFLLGAGPGVAADAAVRLRGRHPTARVAGVWAEGTPDPRHDEESLRKIAACEASVVLVAYGAPGQVTWIERNRPGLEAAGVRVAAGIGGALDYHSGRARLAAPLVRRLGLEWLDRLVREPRRWRRQLVLPVFALLAGWESIRVRLGAGRRRPV